MQSTSPLVTITTDHPSLSLDKERLRPFLASICVEEGYSLEHLSVVLTTHQTVRHLNTIYLSHDYDTDVISFSLLEEDHAVKEKLRLVDGEVYVNLDMASEQCIEYGVAYEEEAVRYVIHGLLHLMGYDDKAPELRHLMKMKENSYLEQFFKT